jgi:hypothetical protein
MTREELSRFLLGLGTGIRHYQQLQELRASRRERRQEREREWDWRLHQRWLSHEEEDLRRRESRKARELVAEKEMRRRQETIELEEMDRRGKIAALRRDPDYWRDVYYKGGKVPAGYRKQFEHEEWKRRQEKEDEEGTGKKGEITVSQLLTIWSRMRPDERKKYKNSFGIYKNAMLREAEWEQPEHPMVYRQTPGYPSAPTPGDLYNQAVLGYFNQPGGAPSEPMSLQSLTRDFRTMDTGEEDAIDLTPAVDPNYLTSDEETELYLLEKWKAGTLTPEESEFLTRIFQKQLMGY